MSKGFSGITELANADYMDALRFPAWMNEPVFYDSANDWVRTDLHQGLEQYLQLSSVHCLTNETCDGERYCILAGNVLYVENGKKRNQTTAQWKYLLSKYTKKMFWLRVEKSGCQQFVYIPTEYDKTNCMATTRFYYKAGELAWWTYSKTNFYYGQKFQNPDEEQQPARKGTNQSANVHLAPGQQTPPQAQPAIQPSKPKSHKWKIAALIIVALLGASYFSSSQKNSSSPPPKKPAVTQQAKAPSVASSSSSSSAQKSEPAPAPAPKPEKKKEVDPVARSGVMTGYNPTEPVLNDSGLCEVTIDNSRNDMPVYVRIWDADAMMPVRSFYIRQGGQFTADNLDPGTYQVRYINLYEGGTASRGSKSENFELEQIQDAYGVQYSQLTLTLYKVRNGNTTTTSIDADEI